MIAVLGNRHAIESLDHGETFQALTKGKRATRIEFAEGITLSDALRTVEDLWPKHAGFPGKTVTVEKGNVGEAHDTLLTSRTPLPAWVASDSPGLAALIAEHFGGIEIRELEEPATSGGSTVGAVLAMLPTMLTTLLTLMVTIPLVAWLFARTRPLLLTNAGKDFAAAQLGGSASATAVGKWVALTANVTAPSASDTTLTAEIATAGGGLIRKAGTYAHTGGTATYTITTVFTANGSDSLPVTIGKRGIFDAASVGNMVFETLISPTATISASGDVLTTTDTVTIS